MSQAADRLDNFYNGDDYDPIKNPGGFAAGGHREHLIPAFRDVVTVSREIADQAGLTAAAASQQEAWGPSFTTATGGVAYLSPTSFTADGDVAATMPIGSHVAADCGEDGYRRGIVAGITGTTVTVSLFDGELTPNLRRVYNAETNTIYLIDYLDFVAAQNSVRESQDAALAAQADAAVSRDAAAASEIAAAGKAEEAAQSAASMASSVATCTTKSDAAQASAGAASTSAIAAAASAASVPADVAASVAYLEAIATLVAGGSVAGVPAPIFAWAPWLTPVLHPRVVFSRASITSYRGRSGYLRYAAANKPVFECDPLTGVCKGLSIEKTSIQDLTHSGQLDNVKYTKARCSIAPNAKTYPDGSTGDKIVEDTSVANSHAIVQSRAIVADTRQCAYAVVSAGERTNMSISLYGASSGYVLSLNLVTKAYYITSFGGAASNPFYGIAELRDGRFLLWMSCLLGAGVTACSSQMSLQDAGGYPVYTGDGASGVYVQSFGSCTGSFPPSYLPTGWETTSATNNTVGTGIKTFTIGYDATVPGRAIPAGATVRVWQTSNPANYMTGTVTSHVGTTLVVSITATGGGSATAADWTIQAGAAMTRAADICTVPLSGLIGSAGEALWTGLEGMLVVQAITAPGKPIYPDLQILVQLDDGSSSNRVIIYRNSTEQVRCAVAVAGVFVVDISVGTVADSTEFRVAFSFVSGAFYAALNGTESASSASGTIPAGLTTERLGCSVIGGSQWCGTIKLVHLYNRAPSNDKVLALSAMGVS